MRLEVGLAHQLVDGHDTEHGGFPHAALHVVVRLEQDKIISICVITNQDPKLTFNNPGITSAT